MMTVINKHSTLLYKFSSLSYCTSPSVQSSMMIQTGFSVMTPISFTMCGWSNWRMVTAGKEEGVQRLVHVFLFCNCWQVTFNKHIHTRETYMLLGETFPWRCLMLSSYTSSLPQTEPGFPARNRPKKLNEQYNNILSMITVCTELNRQTQKSKLKILRFTIFNKSLLEFTENIMFVSHLLKLNYDSNKKYVTVIEWQGHLVQLYSYCEVRTS